MHEDLLGYLLGALEPHEMHRVEQMLQDDPALREQLAQIERALEPLERDLDPTIDPPPTDLVARTMAGIPPLDPQESKSRQQPQATFESLTPMHPELEMVETSHWSWMDWVGGATAAAAILGLLIPSLAQGRFEARKAACQAQLQTLGTAITQFVNLDRQQRLPAVAESGPEAFAGVYAVRLNERGLLPDATKRWCPSMSTLPKRAVTLTPITEVDSIADLHQATPEGLREIQQSAGGHYAFSLGVLDSGRRLRPSRCESRSWFAVMSDAPPVGFTNRVDIDRLSSHHGEGINVLYEDGRVQFVALPTLNSMPDHPLLNNRGEAEAGVNIDDASLAPSWVAPFIHAVQR